VIFNSFSKRVSTCRRRRLLSFRRET